LHGLVYGYVAGVERAKGCARFCGLTDLPLFADFLLAAGRLILSP
jgi:hypothetical protein